MRESVERECAQHPNRYDCPDLVVVYDETFDEYGLVVHDGGRSSILIRYCPWCGARLPESKRDRWFDELERLGFDDPSNQDIPARYRNSEWYR